MREFIIEADGGSRGNPGPAGYGAVVVDAATGETLVERAEYIGVATNNVAEYRGLLAGLRAAHDLDPSAEVHVRMDSKLVIEQMSGRWKIKHPDMRPLAAQAAAIFPRERVTYEWIPREHNRRADRLANEAMDTGTSASSVRRGTPERAEGGAAAGRAEAPAARAEAAGRATGAEADARASGVGVDEQSAGESARGGAAARAARVEADAPSARAEAGARAARAEAAGRASGVGADGRDTGAGADARAARVGVDEPTADVAADAQAARLESDAQSAPAEAGPQSARADADGRAAGAEADARAAGAENDVRAARAEADARATRAEADARAARAENDVRATRAEADARATRAEAAAQATRAEADARAFRAEADVRAARVVATPGVGWGPADMGPPATFVLLRHGETPLTPQKRFSGSGGTDPSLSDIGREQAERVAAVLARRGTIQAIVSSPLTRTRETAAVVAARLGLDVSIDEGLRETDFGAWEGLTFAEVRERYPDDLNAWLASADAAPTGGGESFTATATRIAATRDKLIAAYTGRTVLLVTHVTPIKTLVRLALGAPPESLFRMELSAASLSVVAYYADGNASVRLLNDTSHLR